MRTIIKLLMKLLMLCIIGAGVYFGYTEYSKDERVLVRKTKKLLHNFEKDSTESFGSAIDSAELSSLLDDEIFFKVDTDKFPFTEFFKDNADKNKVLAFHKSLVNQRYTTAFDNEQIKVVKIIPAKDGTAEGEEKTPAKAKVEVSVFLKKESGKRGNIHTDIKCDLLYVKKGRTWKVAYVLFK